MRILAVDYGKKRIGLAISSTVASMALPLCTIEHKGVCPKAAELVFQKVEQLGDIREIVLGWPLFMDGKISPLCIEVGQFKEHLEKLFLGPIHLIDERLTSKIAEDSYRSHGFSRKKQKLFLDQAAAVNILTTFLERKKNSPA
jgi:putative Holliday junction resolvase